jgi:hypothetical protein
VSWLTREALLENEADQALEALETATLSCEPESDITLPAPEPVADLPVAETCELRLAFSTDPAALFVSRCSLMHFLPPQKGRSLSKTLSTIRATRFSLFLKFIFFRQLNLIKASCPPADRQSCNFSGYPL